MSYVLIVDDEPSICWGFEQLLGDEGHEVSVAASAEEALRVVEDRPPDAVVMDVRLPGMDGLTAINHLKNRLGDVPIVIITAFGSLEIAVQAVSEGAFDYLHKPFDLEDATRVVERALNSRKPDAESANSSEAAARVPTEMIGSSPAMQEVFKQIAWVAESPVPVLITGESGTGKELVARAIHRHGDRRDEPFLPICLPALSETLVESELFGHVKGAFTGADRDRKGLLELAGEGTIFLDEISEASLAVQVKLLRALEQREITPVGDARPRSISARIVAATNRSLSDLIAEGTFREDLFFRLSVFQIELPPLRSRLDDIPALVEQFAVAAAPEISRPVITDEAVQTLQSRAWAGNVRELRNAIEHAVILSRGHRIETAHLPPVAPANFGSRQSTKFDLAAAIEHWVEERLQKHPKGGELHEEFLRWVETPLLESILKTCGHNKAAAAGILGIHRSTLRQKLRRYELDPNQD